MKTCTIKKGLFTLSFILISFHAFADPTIEKIIKANGLEKTKVMSLYKNGSLVVTTNTPNQIILQNNKAAQKDSEAINAMYWYRGMQLNEFINFDKNKFQTLPCTKEKSFCGISPQFQYSKSYLTTKNPGVVIEFSTVEPGWLYNDFTVKNKCQVKAEGGGTYGLGLTGTSASCEGKYKKDGLGKVFNTFLNKPVKIDPIISFVLLPK